MLAEVSAKEPIVRLYDIVKDRKRDYRPDLRHVIALEQHGSRLFPGYSHETHTDQYHVVKFAVCETEKLANPCINKVAVLYRCKVADKSGWRMRPYSRDDDWDDLSEEMKLVVYRLDPEFGPVVVDAVDVNVAPGHYPEAIAVSKVGIPLVVFRSFEGRRPKSHLTRYDKPLDPELPNAFITSTLALPEPEPITNNYIDEFFSDIQIRGRKVHLLPPWCPIPQWTVPNFSGRLDIERRNNYLPDDVEAFRSPSLGVAIGSHHHHQITEDELNDGDPTCVNTALELMISREELPNNIPGRTGAFLLKAVHYPDTCEKFDLNKDYPYLYHVFVAKLAGLGSNLFNLSSLGLRVAVSPRSHRIAISNWKRVLVWALDPKAFLDPGTLPDGTVPGDHAYVEGCGWRYYQSGRREIEMVVLEPVELPECGVVFKLEFRREDELWAWTERGLVRWRFGVWAEGRREVVVLE